MTGPGDLAQLVASMMALADRVGDDPRRHFHGVYLRTTEAIATAVRAGRFEDNTWVARWDVAFGGLYVDALRADLAGRPVSGPWRVAFACAAAGGSDLPALRHVLLGMNAHINYDLPQALLAVVPPADVDDAATLALRERDHRRIDAVLAARIAAEGVAVTADVTPARVDRALAGAYRLGTRRFLVESRRRVWSNALVLDRARRRGGSAYADRLAVLEQLVTDRVGPLTRPGRVLIRLAAGGFGVTLPDG